jgi:hypothetical protein
MSRSMELNGVETAQGKIQFVDCNNMQIPILSLYKLSSWYKSVFYLSEIVRRVHFLNRNGQ